MELYHKEVLEEMLEGFSVTLRSRKHPEFLGVKNFGKAHQIKFRFLENHPLEGVSENVWFFKFKHVNGAGGASH